jgi:predicted aminopeptidase
MGVSPSTFKQQIILGLMLLSSSGCSSLGYLLQAGQGQLSFYTHSRPISEVLKDEKTPPRVRSLLGEIEPIKKFGERHGLKPTKNYTEYVKLNRSAAVWVVSACESLKFKSKEWSFPIVGSFPYLGWFDLEGAREFAQDLKKEGWDVDLRGASAFSTLGWFRDPVLSTMIPEGEEALGDLVNVVIHESVHATLYIQGQAYFNESIASFVADQLTLQYLGQTRGANSPEKLVYTQQEEQSQKIRDRLHQAYGKLARLYASNQTDADKLTEKQKILNDLKEDLKFKREINNATLIQYKTYDTGQADFEKLLKECHSDWNRFMTSLGKLNPSSFSQPQQSDFSSAIRPLIQSHCL